MPVLYTVHAMAAFYSSCLSIGMYTVNIGRFDPRCFCQLCSSHLGSLSTCTGNPDRGTFQAIEQT